MSLPVSGEPVKVLTIAGSDSGGAAGLQADLKTFTALGVYGMSAVTVVTAQNSLRVAGVHAIPADFVAWQVDAVLADYGADCVKTGFIGRVDVIECIAEKLAVYRPANLVVDPVLVDHKGEEMFPPAVTQAYAENLLPISDLVTPNRAEAALLTGLQVRDIPDMEAAARSLQTLGARWVLIKGGRHQDEIVDVLFDGQSVFELRSPWIDTTNTHGSGDCLSAAACAYLALGHDMEASVRQAHRFVAKAIRVAAGWRMGGGHGPISYW